MTTQCLEYLFAQDYPNLHIVIVDDGSTDGTGEYLQQLLNPSLTLLQGDGSLWWGGAMRMGMEFVSCVAQDYDYLLMLNDDVRIESNFASTLVDTSIANDGAVVGATQRDENTGAIIGCGYKIDFWGMCFLPLNCSLVAQVDALPGRGVLFPYNAIQSAGNINSTFFVHYFADLEYSSRVRERGWNIIVSRKASVFTSHGSSDRDVQERGWAARRFSSRSKVNLIQRLLFFSLRGPFLLRILVVPRYLLVGGWRFLKGTLLLRFKN